MATKPKQSKAVTQTELEKAADDISYEVMMLLNSRYIHQDAQAKLQNATDLREKTYWITVQNAALEAFLLHYRNLQEFLNNGKFPSDMRAVDYAPSWTPDSRLKTPPEDQRVNQRLAHLTYDRVTHARGWDLEAMERRIGPVLSTFFAQVAAQYSPLFVDCRTNLTGHGY